MTTRRAPVYTSIQGPARRLAEPPWTRRHRLEGRRSSTRSAIRMLPSCHVVRGLAEMFGPDCEVVLHDVAQLPHSIVAIENGAVTGRTVGDVPTDRMLRSLRNADETPGRAPLPLLARRQDPQVARRDAARRATASRSACSGSTTTSRTWSRRSARSPACQRSGRPGGGRRAGERRDLRRRHPRRGRRHDHQDPDRDGQDAGRHVARGEDGGRQAPRRARRVPREALRRAGRRGARPLALHDLQLPQRDPPRRRRRRGRDAAAPTATLPQERRR